MNKFIWIIPILFVGCKAHPDFQEIKLENGNSGYRVDCKMIEESDCLSMSTDVCKNGGKLLHRNIGNVKNTLIISCQ